MFLCEKMLLYFGLFLGHMAQLEKVFYWLCIHSVSVDIFLINMYQVCCYGTVLYATLLYCHVVLLMCCSCGAEDREPRNWQWIWELGPASTRRRNIPRVRTTHREVLLLTALGKKNWVITKDSLVAPIPLCWFVQTASSKSERIYPRKQNTVFLCCDPELNLNADTTQVTKTQYIPVVKGEHIIAPGVNFISRYKPFWKSASSDITSRRVHLWCVTDRWATAHI